MKASALCLFFWFLTTWLETVFFASSSWFKPNLFFAVPVILCLHWRRPETHFIFLLFGLTADSFSTLPFGIFALTFFLVSFFVRRQAVRIYQESTLSTPHILIVSAVSVLTLDILTPLILFVWFAEETFGWEWLSGALLNEVLSTAAISIPLHHALKKIEQKISS